MSLYVVEHVNRKTHEIHVETFSDFEDALHDFRHKDDADAEESYLYLPEDDEASALNRLRAIAAAYNTGRTTEDGVVYRYTIRENHETA